MWHTLTPSKVVVVEVINLAIILSSIPQWIMDLLPLLWQDPKVPLDTMLHPSPLHIRDMGCQDMMISVRGLFMIALALW